MNRVASIAFLHVWLIWLRLSSLSRLTPRLETQSDGCNTSLALPIKKLLRIVFLMKRELNWLTSVLLGLHTNLLMVFHSITSLFVLIHCIPKVWCVQTCHHFLLLQKQRYQFKSSMVPVYLLTETYLVLSLSVRDTSLSTLKRDKIEFRWSIFSLDTITHSQLQWNLYYSLPGVFLSG